MASSFVLLLLSSLLLFYTTTSYAQRFLPPAVILPVQKDPSTHRYITQINQGSPHVPVQLTVDLSGNTLWVDCEKGFMSSSYRPTTCNSVDCTLADAKTCLSCNGKRKPGCNPNTCNLPTTNPLDGLSRLGEVSSDVVSVASSDGKSLGKVVSLPSFLFVCGNTDLLKGHANGVKGIAGLGRTKIALPSQLSRRFVFPNVFGICLTSGSVSTKGVIYFGAEPFFLSPNKEISSNLVYTPLVTNPAGNATSEYYVGVKSIKVIDKVVPINAALLSIKKDGSGGTKISTVTPYTIMESSIYNAVVKAFVGALSKVSRVPPVAPFGACFNTKGLSPTRVGYNVPAIDFVFQNNHYWRIFGANSMVSINRNVACLGFVDGGKNLRTSIEIGGYQLEDNFVQFDLKASRVGFTSNLAFIQTTCANFNFTTNPNIVN